ncbi:MAG: hypothetical protein H7A55_21470 [Verrucomicrobiaceae bacterium]|nr:hypothetical protein [Verrucomicrobiaceae bacterium]
MHHSILLLSLGILASTAIGADPLPAPRPSPQERLNRVEEQMALLLEELRSIRRDLDAGAVSGSTAAEAPAMIPGCIAKTYVRTGGANITSAPPAKATPSDERAVTGDSFDAARHRSAVGYGDDRVTVLWEGFFLVTEKDTYEFIFGGRQGSVRVGGQIISSKEKSVRLELPPGYHPIQVMDYMMGMVKYPSPSLTVKRSGLDPIPLTPGSLWMAETVGK